MPLKDPEARRDYHREYMRQKLANDPAYKAKHLARISANNQRYHAEVDRLINEFKVNGCLICHEKELCCLSAHHLNGSDKQFSVGDARRRKITPKRVREELAKCICLCENCHRKLHHGIITLPGTVCE